MSDMPGFPELQTALLDGGTLRRLFAELSAVQLHDVTVKRSATSFSSSSIATLEQAHAELERGDVIGVQLRYRFGDHEWCDSLLRTADGIRLVRLRTT
jgi:hypothetical protein